MITYEDGQSGPVVDVIIPARNEQDNIAKLLEQLPPKLIRHAIVVDNGSTDGTSQLAAEGGAVVVGERSRGYGAACLAGLAWIDRHEPPPDMVAFIDADLADDPAQLPMLCAPVADHRADLVIGCRHRAAEPGALTSVQRFGNRLSCWLIYFLTGKRFGDLGPMRVVDYQCLRSLRMRDRTWGWTVEMQYKAAAMGLRTLDIDVPYRRRRAGKSKISGTWMGSVRAGAKIITTITRLWWQHRSRRKPSIRSDG